MSRHSEDSQPYRRARRQFLDRFPTCWLCGHLGANQIDHDPPQSIVRTRLNIATWRPAHGPPGGCPTCGKHCNQVRGVKARVVPVQRASRDW